jgi:hypothetical protein
VRETQASNWKHRHCRATASHFFSSSQKNVTVVNAGALVGLQGVLKVSHAIVHGISVLNLDGFAPLNRWPELSPAAATGSDPPGSEVA